MKPGWKKPGFLVLKHIIEVLEIIYDGSRFISALEKKKGA
jgi:hypothetical protein